MPGIHDFSGHTFYNFPLMVEKRDELRDYLFKNRIETGMNYSFIQPHTTSYHVEERYPLSEKAALSVLTLPTFPELQDEEVDFVIQKVSAYFR
jgi:dTDP-4-amino-4,6-dideoxygalactose transaminase